MDLVGYLFKRQSMTLEGYGEWLGVMEELKGEKKVDSTIFPCMELSIIQKNLKI